MTTEQLKPCPFCGAIDDEIQPSISKNNGVYYVWARCCDFEGPLYDTREAAIAAWNRRTPVEQLSAQTAEPVAWRREWNGDVSDINNYVYASCEEELDTFGEWQPLYTHPAKTEQPSLSDAEITDEQICEVLLLVGVSPYGYPKSGDRFIRNDTKRIITAFRALLAQRQDSNKDAERYRHVKSDYSNGKVDIMIIKHVWVDGFGKVPNILTGDRADEEIDRAIANGAQE